MHRNSNAEARHKRIDRRKAERAILSRRIQRQVAKESRRAEPANREPRQ